MKKISPIIISFCMGAIALTLSSENLFAEDNSSASITEMDFQKVIITHNSDDVKGLERIDEVSASAHMFFGDPTSLHERATEKIKKEAAKRGASIVLIQSDNFAATPINNVSLVGVAYSKKSVEVNNDSKKSDSQTQQIIQSHQGTDTEVLNNDSIVKLVKAGIPEDTVVDMVKAKQANFDVSVDGILALKTNGVGDKIIHEMVLHGQGKPVATPPVKQPEPAAPAIEPIATAKIVEPAKPVEPPVAVAVSTATAPTTTAPVKISDPTIEALCMALNQENAGKVIEALKKLRKFKSPESVPSILPCLANQNPKIVVEACRTLTVIGEHSAATAVLPLLKNERPEIVREACRTLAVTGSKDTVSTLEPLLTNPRSDIRDEAYKAITKLKSE